MKNEWQSIVITLCPGYTRGEPAGSGGWYVGGRADNGACSYHGPHSDAWQARDSVVDLRRARRAAGDSDPLTSYWLELRGMDQSRIYYMAGFVRPE